MLIFERRIAGPGARSVDVAIAERGHNLRADLHFNDGIARPQRPAALTLTIEVMLATPAYCGATGHWRGTTEACRTGWNLEVDRLSDLGPLVDARSWVNRRLGGAECRHDGHGHLEMDEVARVLLDRARVLCDADARSAASRFPSAARFFTYAALVADRTGRIAQMIEVCPSVLTIAAICDPFGSTVANIAAGRKLPELIELVVAKLAKAHRQTGANIACSRFATTLVRYAPIMELRDLQSLLFAPGLDVNDMHAAGDRRASWFSTMVDWGAHAKMIRDRERAASIGAFLSHHAVELASEGRFQLQEMVDWAQRSSDRAPCRTSSPRRVRRAIASWHDALHRGNAPAGHWPLAKGPFVHSDAMEIHPIKTVAELCAEGREQRHCAASFSRDAMAGAMFFYRANIDGERVTIAISGQPGCRELVQATGAANRALTKREHAVVLRWISTL